MSFALFSAQSERFVWDKNSRSARGESGWVRVKEIQPFWLYPNKGRNSNGEAIQVIIETKIILVKIWGDTAQSPNCRPLSIITIAISARGIILMLSNKALALPVVGIAGNPVPTTLPKTATINRIITKFRLGAKDSISSCQPI